MILQELKAGNASKLDRIQHIVFFGTQYSGQRCQSSFNGLIDKLDKLILTRE